MTRHRARPLPNRALRLFTIAEVALCVAVLAWAATGHIWMVLLTGWVLMNVTFTRGLIQRTYRRELITAANSGEKIRS